VYVPAAKWRALEAEGLVPDEKVRQLALDALDRHLAGSVEGSRALMQTEPHPGYEVRTDFKGEKKGRR